MNRNERLNILIVDDQQFAQLENRQIVSELCKEISSVKPNIVLASSIQEMNECLKSQDFHIVLLDKDLGPSKMTQIQENEVHQVGITCNNQDGLEYIPSILGIQPHVRIIMITAYKDTQLAVKAIQNGAMDYITKGVGPYEVEYKNKQILKALRDSQLELRALRRPYCQIDSFTNEYAYQSKPMKKIDKNLKALSQVSSPVLILGESGAGKTETAKRLGKLTQKFRKERERVFININVSAISDTLIESELFGHEKGAFTGATETCRGLFEIARNGDLFLDEIGDASLKLQSKILKVICEKEFLRVGGKTSIKTNARLIFATNKNLESMVEKGLFREDLYARISTAILEMPSLKERKEDIPILSQSITSVLNKKNNKNISYADFPPPLQDYFKENNFKFNIRGLRNDIERLMIFCPLKPNGKLDYKKWKHILSYKDFQRGSEVENLELDQLMNFVASKIVKEDGPGLKYAKDLFEKKIFSKVQSDFPKNRDRAKILKISESLASIKFKV